jgi:pimeloyl-ACP methyl ester carboxylesterase
MVEGMEPMGNVVLVHGAWHGAWCWDGVLAELHDRAVVAVAVELPFSGFTDDVAAARSAISSAGPDVVVCAHSYGGVVVNEATLDLNNVGHIVYLAAFINTGDLSPVLSGPLPLLDGIIDLADGRSRFDPELAHRIFYGDSDAPSVAAITPRLRPMVMGGPEIAGPGLHQASVPTTYVVCGRDQAIPPQAQYAMAERSTTVVEWPTDHSPFLTRPGQVADLLQAVSQGGPAGAQPNSFPITDTNDSISPG